MLRIGIGFRSVSCFSAKPSAEIRIRKFLLLEEERNLDLQPEPAQILMELHGRELLRGEIIDISDSGDREDAFAVVDVEGLSQSVVVAMRNVTEIGCE